MLYLDIFEGPGYVIGRAGKIMNVIATLYLCALREARY